MVFYLIRHPETVRNTEGKFGGWERCEYSKLGYIQFEKIVKYFSDNKKIIYSSDLSRAKILAEKIANNCGSELIIDVALRECNFKETAPYDSYETYNDLMKRIFYFLKGLDSDSIIISHAKVVDAIVENLCGKDVLVNMKLHPRDVVFKIDTIKNENKLSIIHI